MLPFIPGYQRYIHAGPELRLSNHKLRLEAVANHRPQRSMTRNPLSKG